jgi:hypothetical protein
MRNGIQIAYPIQQPFELFNASPLKLPRVVSPFELGVAVCVGSASGCLRPAS